MTPIATRDYFHWHAGLEAPAADEAALIEELSATLLSISRKTFEDGGRGLRSVHAKSHGLLRGELIVLDDLAPHLRQGLFAKGGRYRAVARISTTPGDLLPDAVSTPRGFALKVEGVSGARLPGDDETDTQDFVLVNAPAFANPDLKSFLGDLKLLAATTDRLDGGKVVLAKTLQATERLLEKSGHGSGKLKALGGHPATHPLGERYFSQAAIRFGDYVAKVSLVPGSAALQALAGQLLDINHHQDALRDAVSSFFQQHEATWELQVQLCTDIAAMPIEDASVPWPTDQSPYVTVALLVMPPQPSWDAERTKAIDDCTSFSPWHALAAHQPLGAVMRARREPYRHSAEFRRQQNGCPAHRAGSNGS